MTPAHPQTLQALEDLRRTAAAVVELVDMAILGRHIDATRAVRSLPNRLRVLRFRVNRALTALESEGRP